MLAYILALAVGFGSFGLYMAAFFFPEVHRKNDLIWSGIGLFYALVLWVCAGQIRGGLLLGQTASVALLGWLAWQTLTLRRNLTPVDQQTQITNSPASMGEALQEKLKGLPSGFSKLPEQLTGAVSTAQGWTQGALSKAKNSSPAPSSSAIPTKKPSAKEPIIRRSPTEPSASEPLSEPLGVRVEESLMSSEQPAVAEPTIAPVSSTEEAEAASISELTTDVEPITDSEPSTETVTVVEPLTAIPITVQERPTVTSPVARPTLVVRVADLLTSIKDQLLSTLKGGSKRQTQPGTSTPTPTPAVESSAEDDLDVDEEVLVEEIAETVERLEEAIAEDEATLATDAPTPDPLQNFVPEEPLVKTDTPEVDVAQGDVAEEKLDTVGTDTGSVITDEDAIAAVANVGTTAEPIDQPMGTSADTNTEIADAEGIVSSGEPTAHTKAISTDTEDAKTEDLPELIPPNPPAPELVQAAQTENETSDNSAPAYQEQPPEQPPES